MDDYHQKYYSEQRFSQAFVRNEWRVLYEKIFMLQG